MNESDVTGPTMLILTDLLKPPQARWGKFFVTLPRPVAVKKLAAASIGGISGAVLGVLVFGIKGALYGGVLFGFLAVVATSYSPLKGETLTHWLGLSIKTRTQKQIYIDGKPAAYSIGVCPIPAPDVRSVRLRPSTVFVAPGSVDERGVFRDDYEHIIMNNPFPSF